jgi:hypothetical protein
MTERIVSLLVFAGLFVLFGVMNMRMSMGGCGGGSCGDVGPDGAAGCSGSCGCGLSGEAEPARPDHGIHDDEKNPAGWWG